MRYAQDVISLRPTWLLCVLVAVVWASAACRSARAKVDGDIVHQVDFEGIGPPFVRPFSKAELRGAMAQKQSGLGVRTPGLTWAARTVPLDPAQLDQDTYRLETWLAHHGYFNARVEGWRVVTRRPRVTRDDGTIRKAAVVDVIGKLSFGEVSTVRTFDVAWQDQEADRFWRSAQEGLVKRKGYTREGEPFNLDYVDYDVNELLRRMKENGYIHATAKARIDAYPEQGVVDVVIEATTGPPTNIGSLVVKGEERVTEEQIREILRPMKQGSELTSTLIREAQQRLIGTEVFSVVRVEPDTSEPVADVPVTVTVDEGPFGVARAGFGTVYDGMTVTPRLSTTITNHNISRSLDSLEAAANLGIGIPLQGGVDASRLLYGASLGYIRPRIAGPKWDFSAQASYQKDLLAGQLLFTRARLSATLTHHFTDKVFASFGPSGELVRLGPGGLLSTSDAGLTESDKLLVSATYGGDPDNVRNPFALPLLEGRLTIDWRKGEGGDVAQDPRGGYYYQLAVRQALPTGPEAFRFTDLYGEARLYRSLLSRNKRNVPYTLALRLRGHALLGGNGDPEASFEDAIPYSERAFLGGAYDMRGFRINQVGPYDCVCLVQEEAIVSGPFWPFTRDTGGTRLDANPTFLPRGGRFAGLVSGEVRRRWPSGRGLALFGDVGVLARSHKELLPANLPRSLRWDVGLGFRQDTPVGPLRVDLAFRPSYPADQAPIREANFTGQPSDPSDPGYYRGRYYGCDAIPDSRLPTRATGLTFGQDLPVIVNLAIAIGEAL